MADHIPTTQTLVSKLRRLAKKRSQETNSPLHQCQEQVAQETGYHHWKHLLLCQELTGADTKPVAGKITEIRDADISLGKNEGISQGIALTELSPELFKQVRASLSSLQAQGLAPAIYNPLKGNVFIDVTIEGHRFQGVVHDPLRITLIGRNRTGDCPLGVASIAHAQHYHTQQGPAYWAVCKYGNQTHIDISGLSDAGRRRLAIEFGLPFFPPVIRISLEWAMFYGSKAYAALVEWAKMHPRKIKQYEYNTYLGHWSLAATLDAGLAPSKAQLDWIEQRADRRAHFSSAGTDQAETTSPIIHDDQTRPRK